MIVGKGEGDCALLQIYFHLHIHAFLKLNPCIHPCIRRPTVTEYLTPMPEVANCLARVVRSLGLPLTAIHHSNHYFPISSVSNVHGKHKWPCPSYHNVQ